MAKIDEAADIRKGEEFDTARIGEYLKDNIKGLEGDIKVGQFPSGFSNLTYLISFDNRDLVLRRPPFGKKARSAHDMGREYRILKALQSRFPYSPKPLLYCEDGSLMGCPFYVMERIEGIILRKDLPQDMRLSPEDAKKLSENYIDILCSLHSLDHKELGLENLGRPEGYIKRQVEGWIRRYRDAKTEDAPDCEKIMKWLIEKMPQDIDKPSIIHNDYKFDNIVLNPEDPLQIIGVLDWEMATVGNPLMDLGNSLAYWIQKEDPDNLQMIRMNATNVKGMLSREEQVSLYAEKMGLVPDNFDYYYCFGLFRLAVIAQQIYYRYYHGQTKDERFKMLIFAVKVLEETSLNVIERSEL